MTDYEQTIYNLFDMTKKYEEAPACALGLKLSEETGEFSEALLYELGYLHHKKDKVFEPPMEEAADIINVLTGVLAVHYPEKTTEMLLVELLAALNKKGRKYAKILGVEDEYFGDE